MRMGLSITERQFVDWWKRRDFFDWNESAVREEFIAPLLRVLGYAKGTVMDILYEKSVRLSEPYHRVGRKTIQIDYIPTIRLRNFWIIEAKPVCRKRWSLENFFKSIFTLFTLR